MRHDRLNLTVTRTVYLCLTLSFAVSSRGDDTRATTLQVFPEKIALTGPNAFQSFVIQATQADGITRDVTDRARVSLSDGEIVSRSDNLLRAHSDGQARLTVNLDGKRVVVPVTVSRYEQPRPVSFRRDVMPVLMKAGCNSGVCHGASRGQNGFRLSVFGFDPKADHFRLTRERIGRRVNLVEPRSSLILQKPTESIAHGGGRRFDSDSELYAILYDWLSTGARDDFADAPVATHVELFPSGAVLESDGDTQQLVVRARYSDGGERDVTSLTVFSSNDPAVASVDGPGRVKSLRRGESFILARFDAFSVGMPVIVVPRDQPFEFPDTLEHNEIDTLVYRKLRKLRVAPSELSGDREFLRRVTLDMIGLLPSPDEYKNFLADDDPHKRKRVIDELLQRSEFSDLWVMKWADLLQINRLKGGFFPWLRDNYLANVPVDEMVRELLTAEGGFFRDPPAQYFRKVGKPKELAENVAQVFMGVRIQCAQCHNHPFDRWTMDDYYGFAAFFTQLGSKRNWEDTREKIVFNTGMGDMKHPNDDRIMPPTFPDRTVPDIAGRDRRAVLAEWLTSADNPYFSRNLANIAWAQFFGRGIVEPVDDVRVSNPAANDPLLDMLARRLVGYGYDFRRLIRDICNSRTYQLSSRTSPTNAFDNRNFSHSTIRRLRAEVLHDIICQVTESPSRFGGFPLGTRATQLPVSSISNYFLQTFGRSTRTTVCACEVDVEPNLSQVLHLINSDTTWGKIGSGAVITQLLKQHQEKPLSVADFLYIRCLTRPPTAAEQTRLDGFLSDNPDDHQAILEELFWALLNSKEFLFNH